MVAAVQYLLVLLLFCTLVSKGLCGQCSKANITIGEVRTGREVKGKLEWNVSVINECNCAQDQVLVSCRGFRTTERVPVVLLHRIGPNCVVGNGHPIAPHSAVQFTYAWDPPYIFVPRYARSLC